MSIKEMIDKTINLGYLLGNDLVLEPIKTFSSLIKHLYLKDKLKAVIILFTVFIIFGLSSFLSYKIFIERNLGLNTSSQSLSQSNSQTQTIQSNFDNIRAIGGEGTVKGTDSTDIDGKERATSMYLESYKGFFGYIGDFFEDYVSNTADPLGHATTDNSGITFDPVVNKNSIIKFASTSNTSIFYSAYRYASILIGIVAPILVLMVVITGIELLISQNNHSTFGKLIKKLTRICVTVALIFVGMPLLLTTSIMTTNLVNRLILSSGGATCPAGAGQPPGTKKDLKCFIETINDNIRKSTIKDHRNNIVEGEDKGNQPRTVEIDGWDIGSMLKVQGQNFWGFFQIAPIILITAFMLILLFVVFIQFVIRYLQIYFLFAIYPIVAVMWYNESTSKYFSEYWKQLVTLLIQQPVFLLCFAIFGDISINLIADIGNPSKAGSMLIFAIYMVFLVTVPQALTARIFGDVFAYQSSQEFSDKMNYVGNKAQAGFNSVKQKGEQIVGSGIGKATNTVSKGGKNVIWNTPGVAKNAALGIASGTSSIVKDPIGTVKNLPANLGKLAQKVGESAKAGIKNTSNTVMDQSELAMTGKISSPRTKAGFIKTQNEIQNQEKWSKYSKQEKGNSGNNLDNKTSKGKNNQSNQNNQDKQSNQNSQSNQSNLNSQSNQSNLNSQNYPSNVKYEPSLKTIPSDRQKSIEAGIMRKQQKLSSR
jgi:TrbL/VirB6 plasmid conjugal transfer protein